MAKFFKKMKKKLAEAKLERQRISVANKIIQQRAVTAALQERQKQAIEFAVEREKLRTKAKLAKIKATTQPRPRFPIGFGAPFVEKARTKKGKKKKRKHKRRRAIYITERQPTPRSESNFFDIANTVP